MRAVGVDIGSVRSPSKFAWAVVDSSEGTLLSSGDDPEGAVQALVRSIAECERTVLAVEAPMAIPVPAPNSDEWPLLGRARTGEGSRAWSAGAGAGALATGVAQTAWILSRLHILAPRATVTTQSQRFTAGEADLLLTEAFVSGAGKPVPVASGQHAADAEAAARATLTYLIDGSDGFPVVECAPRRALNLLAVLADWADMPVPRDELHSDPLVVRTRPTT
jgi:hypothetical protein